MTTTITIPTITIRMNPCAVSHKLHFFKLFEK